MKSLIDILYPHREWLFWAATCAALNYLFRKKSPEAWEAWALKKPVLAFIIELLRAFGIDPKKMAVAWKRFADRKAGNVPEDLWDGLPISPTLKGALRDPAKRALLEELLGRGAETPRPSLPPPSTPLT